MRKAGLNIMMSMKGDGKPVSFIEDCAVPLEHLAEYTARLTAVFEKHGTRGTWYAHASVGTLHVRPVLDMRRDGARKMRAIAEEACAMVREFKGSAYSGEHGDGLVRSEWIEPILGPRLTQALGEVKSLFDPKGLMNPGKIVRPSKMDDRSLFRFKPGYATIKLATALDWSDWTVPGAQSTGLAAAAEMCNNNGHCRKFDAGTMCPSYRVTKDEQHLTRGRANTLRLALSGQLGPDGIASEAVHEAMELCVSCKGCKRECPTGVDMARMKIEHLHHWHAKRGWTMKDRMVAYLPRYAPWAARMAPMMNFLQELGKGPLGFAPERRLPAWRGDTFLSSADAHPRRRRGAVRRYLHQLPRAGKCARGAGRPRGGRREGAFRPCGRMAAGRFAAAGPIFPPAWSSTRESKRGAWSPLCCRSPGAACRSSAWSPRACTRSRMNSLRCCRERNRLLVARQAMLFEEWIAREADGGRLRLPLRPVAARKALLHGHCHQKAFGAMPCRAEAPSGWCRARGGDRRVVMLRHGGQLSATKLRTMPSR